MLTGKPVKYNKINTFKEPPDFLVNHNTIIICTQSSQASELYYEETIHRHSGNLADVNKSGKSSPFPWFPRISHTSWVTNRDTLVFTLTSMLFGLF